MRKLKKQVTVLTVALLAMSSFFSCSDKEETTMTFEVSTGITAAHLFNGYEPYQENDFNLSSERWKLNLQVLVYDNEGTLVDQAEKSCSELTESLVYSPMLKPGTYTLVSIADFRDGLGGSGYKFWNIANTSKLEDLSITENENVYPVVFETLGLDIQDITVTDRPVSINVDIKPYTALVHIYENNDDHIGYGTSGYSRFVPITEGYFIRSNKSKGIVKIENHNFSSKYVEQTAENNLAISAVMDDWLDRKNPLQHSYRALLPDENCSFKWHIQKAEYEKDDVLSQLAGSIITDGVSNQSVDLLSGKQYVINMILDCLSMDVFEYPKEYKAYDYSQLQVDQFIKKCIDEMMKYSYESILAKDENFANTFLGGEPKKHAWSSSNSLYLAYYDRPGIDRIEVERTVGYLNEKTNCAVVVQFLLPLLSDELIEYFKEKLANKYRVDAEYTSPNNYAYIDPDVDVDSHYRIVLQKKEYDSKPYYFLMYILRDKYTPKDEDNEEQTPTKIEQIFPYEWESFLRQDVDTVLKTLGSGNVTEADGNIYYYNINDLVSSWCLVPNSENKVKSIMVMLKYDRDEEVDSLVTEYLSEHFYPTPIANMYIDTEDIPSRTMSVTFNGGVLNYSVYP